MTRKPPPPGAASLMLMGALILGAAALIAYYVPIAGITEGTASAEAASPVELPSALDPLEQRTGSLERFQAELKVREEALQVREAQVAALKVDLTAQQAQADAVRQAAGLYMAMPPSRAAPLLQGLETGQAIQVLRLIDADQAAAILAYMDPERGALLLAELMKPVAAGSTVDTWRGFAP